MCNLTKLTSLQPCLKTIYYAASEDIDRDLSFLAHAQENFLVIDLKIFL